MRWSANLAYAVGLITTDGCLSKDGRHITLVSKDIEQLNNFAKSLNLRNKIGRHSGSYAPQNKYYRIQFGDVELYRFLITIGLMPNKSKILNKLKIPDKYFRDFLRGCLDGDGFTYSYWDKRWKSSFMIYLGFVSASKSHLEWLSAEIERLYDVKGKIKFNVRAFTLVYAKKASLSIIQNVYYNKTLLCLTRKRFKIEQALDIIQQQAGMLKLVNRLP